MSATVLYDLVVKTGEYPDPQNNGQMKARWLNVGKAIKSDNGSVSLKIEALPAHSWDGWINCFEPKSNGGGGGQPQFANQATPQQAQFNNQQAQHQGQQQAPQQAQFNNQQTPQQQVPQQQGQQMGNDPFGNSNNPFG